MVQDEPVSPVLFWGRGKTYWNYAFSEKTPLLERSGFATDRHDQKLAQPVSRAPWSWEG
jgi:hypothetical protein